jgi:hypothetical protein
MNPGAQRPAHGGHVQGAKREFSLYHSRSASRLKAAVHIHISALAARRKPKNSLGWTRPRLFVQDVFPKG